MKLQVSVEDLSKSKVYLDEGSFIYVRPMTHDELASFSPKYQKKGKMTDEDSVKLTFEILERCIEGWEGLFDTNGKEIPFKRELIKPVLSALLSDKPEAFQKLSEKAMILINKVEEEKKK
jgi:hypothetical protein